MACTGKRKGSYTACIEDISSAEIKRHAQHVRKYLRKRREEKYQVYADADTKIPGKRGIHE
jgi:hypothetical protein